MILIDNLEDHDLKKALWIYQVCDLAYDQAILAALLTILGIIQIDFIKPVVLLG